MAQIQSYRTAEESYGLRLGRTKPLYLSTLALPTDPEKLADAKRMKPIWVPNFSGRRHEPPRNPEALPLQGDPLFTAGANRTPTVDIIPTVNIAGMSESVSGAGVPDVNGEVGRDFYVQMVNVTYFRVYDKMGNAVSSAIPANTIWNQVGLSSFGDPIILYDQQVDRWLMTEFASVGARTVLVAISDSPDPRGSWTAYKFQTPRFPDFPKYGIWGDGYYFTANESGGAFPIYAINRADMLAGEDTVRFQRLTVPKIGGVGFEVGQPVDWDGMTPPPPGSPMLLVKLNDDAWGTTSQDVIMLHRITIDWENSANSKIEVEPVPTAPYDTDGCQLENTGGFSCIPQPNNQGIDGAEWIITNKAVYRHFPTHEVFVMSFLVDVTGEDVGGIRWIEFRRTSTEEWHIHQEGTVGSDDGLHRFMPTIAIDGQGNIGLGYGVSGYAKFPSLRFTGRYSTDAPGAMTFTEYEIASGGGSWGSDRYGDYFSMSVDPADESTFWFTGQYIPTNNQWATRIAAFAASRDTFDLLPVSLIAPTSSPELTGQEDVIIDILNRGLRNVDSFTVAYQFNEEQWFSEPAADSLAVDSLYRHTFTQPVAFDNPGAYPLRIAVSLDQDGNRRNDTLTYTVIKYAFTDMVVLHVPPAQAELVCSDNTQSTIRLINAGLDTLKSAELELSVNGVPADTIQWQGLLAFSESEEITITVRSLVEGSNQLLINTLTVNGGADEIPSNNEAAFSLTASPDGEPAFLSFRTDNFPQETTWRLTDSGNNIIAQGGPYAQNQTVYNEAFCLDANACYTFTVFDSFGDGMSAQGVTGDYEIVDSEGDVLAELDRPNFGSQTSSAFCLADTCLLSIDAAVGPASVPGAQDGFVLILPSNALGPVTYSIDNGPPQATALFAGLLPGTYVFDAVDGAGCTASVVVTIGACMLDATITTTPAIGGDVGTIQVSVTGAAGQAEVSLNGGVFTSDTLYSMLKPGNYVVEVRDSIGCSVIDTVTVASTVSTEGETAFTGITISPNPGQGLFDITARLADDRIFVPVTVYSTQGEPVLRSSIVRYDASHRGQLFLRHLPPGTYFLVIQSGTEWLARRIVNLP